MKKSWKPKVGELVFCRIDSSVYQILEVNTTGYGYTEFLVHWPEVGLRSLSTLNCIPIEHLKDFEYDNITRSKGEENDYGRKY